MTIQSLDQNVLQLFTTAERAVFLFLQNGAKKQPHPLLIHILRL